MIKNTLAQWVKTADNGKPITIAQLARSTGISPTTLSKLRKDPTIKPCIHTIEKICDRYGCSPMDLIKHLKK
jgi:DNA-binding Xre family transcriptional regulator